MKGFIGVLFYMLATLNTVAQQLPSAKVRLDQKLRQDSINVMAMAEKSQAIQQKAQDSLATLNTMPGVYKIHLPKAAQSQFERADSLHQVARTQGDRVQSIVGQLNGNDPQLPQDLTPVKNKIDSLQMLQQASLPTLHQLPDLPGGEIKSQYLPLLDSVRNISMKAERLNLKEERLSDSLKHVVIRQKETFWDRTFWEGIVGVSSDFNVVTLAPSLGIKLPKAFSIGLGPNVGLNTKKASENLLLGFRSFAKYELLKEKLHIQFEDHGYFNRFTHSTGQEGASRAINQLFYVGLEYLMKYSEFKRINVSALYQLNQGQTTPYAYSPFILRIGISAFKPSAPKP